MNIDKVLIANNKRTTLLQSIEKHSAKRRWIQIGLIAAWAGSIAVEATAPNFAPTTVGVVHTASVAALLAIWGTKALRNKKLKKLETTIIEAGNKKEQPKATQLNSAEKQAKKVNWAYNLTGVAVGIWGCQAIVALVPELVGVSVLQTAVLFGSVIVARRLSSKHYEQQHTAQYERYQLANKIAQRHNVVPAEPKVAAAKLK